MNLDNIDKSENIQEKFKKEVNSSTTNDIVNSRISKINYGKHHKNNISNKTDKETSIINKSNVLSNNKPADESIIKLSKQNEDIYADKSCNIKDNIDAKDNSGKEKKKKRENRSEPVKPVLNKDENDISFEGKKEYKRCVEDNTNISFQEVKKSSNNKSLNEVIANEKKLSNNKKPHAGQLLYAINNKMQSNNNFQKNNNFNKKKDSSKFEVVVNKFNLIL